MLTHITRSIGPAVPIADSLDAALAMTDHPPRPARAAVSQTADEQRPTPVTAIAKSDPDAARFIQEWLGVLIEQDVSGQSELVTTLTTFLEHNHDYDSTSRALGIHRSTTRYRIHRVAQLTQLDLRDPETIRNLRAATRAFTRLSDTP
jgi:DNA-binding PucR family transcriptional regulator